LPLPFVSLLPLVSPWSPPITAQSYCKKSVQKIALKISFNGCMDTLVPQCAGTPPAGTLGFLIINKTGMTARNTTPNILKLSMKASIADWACTRL
jgi:hypothetical protein